MKAGVGQRLARGLSPPEMLSEGHGRLLSVAQHLQIVVGVIALASIWALPDAARRDQLVVTALLVGVHLPWTLLSRHIALLSDGPLARILSLSFDLLAISCFALVIPYTRTAVMFAYVLVIAFHAYVSGRTAGLVMCAASLLLVLLAELLAPATERHDGFTLVMYGVVMVALAVMVDALAAERRRTARHLSRLYRAIESLAADPSLSATTDSIAKAAKEAVNAGAVAIFLPRPEDGEVEIAGQCDFPEAAGEELRFALHDLHRRPAGVAMATGRPVSVPDITADERFSHLAGTLARYGAASMVAIPLGTSAHPIGVLTAYFDEPGALDEEDLHLLSAYARQASTTVIRALAFEQERRAATRLAQADQLKSDFVSTVSHELRTPLTSICGFVDTVLLQWDRLDDQAKRDLLQRTAWNAAELRRLIEQVLAFSALDAAETASELSPYALAEGVRELVRHVGPALRDCPVDVDIDETLVVRASTETVHHVLGNLLTNASKFSPTGSPIRVIGRRDGTVAHISVIDEGTGISPEDHERIFERFYRGSTTRHTRGTGIGLAIVQASVEAMGGTVSVQSEVGVGSTFIVTLPLVGAPAATSAGGPAASTDAGARASEPTAIAG